MVSSQPRSARTDIKITVDGHPVRSARDHRLGVQKVRETRSILLHTVFRPRQRAPRRLISRQAPVALCTAVHNVARRRQFASFCSVGAHFPRVGKRDAKRGVTGITGTLRRELGLTELGTSGFQDQRSTIRSRSPESGRRTAQCTWRNRRF